MNKKIVALGGGTGLSTLLKGLKQFPVDITAIVTVSDDGNSTGRLREEFKTPAVGDIRRVITSLSETEPLIESLMNYRFKTTSDLDGHTLGNLLLTGLIEVSGNMSKGIESLSKVLNLKGKVLPLTEDNVKLMAEMDDGNIISGECNITKDKRKIKKMFYKEEPKVLEEVINEIKRADLIILSMGSLYTSIIPNLICKDVIEAIDESSADIMYVCNIMTQPGETDNFKASDHIKTLNKYLGKRKINIALINNGKISKDIKNKYLVEEQKDEVIPDVDIIKKENVNVITDNFVIISDNMIRHNINKLGFHIFSYLIL
ncbi:MAG: uridine diphosphate-N-acetylglucosamine-binding protein YvcK [Candidatus Faecisoma sp.]|nr:uridine diphosphate-N-acetylglucosamine-binding protein YvcK [Candidatus Faecisoma sp.]